MGISRLRCTMRLEGWSVKTLILLIEYAVNGFREFPEYRVRRGSRPTNQATCSGALPSVPS